MFCCRLAYSINVYNFSCGLSVCLMSVTKCIVVYDSPMDFRRLGGKRGNARSPFPASLSAPSASRLSGPWCIDTLRHNASILIITSRCPHGYAFTHYGFSRLSIFPRFFRRLIFCSVPCERSTRLPASAWARCFEYTLLKFSYGIVSEKVFGCSHNLHLIMHRNIGLYRTVG